MLYANWPVTCEDHRTWDSDEGEGRVAAVDKKLVCEGVGHGQHEDDCFETFATTPVAARVRLLVGRGPLSSRTGGSIDNTGSYHGMGTVLQHLLFPRLLT